MCQQFDAEYNFCTFLEKNGYAFKCKKCWRTSYMQNDRCSWCEYEKQKATKALEE